MMQKSVHKDFFFSNLFVLFWMQDYKQRLDTCCRVMVLILLAHHPAPQLTPNNIRKGRQSFQGIVSLPPTSPDDFQCFFGASWAFCADFLFYIHERGIMMMIIQKGVDEMMNERDICKIYEFCG